MITLEEIETIIQIIAEMAPDHRREECVNVTKDGAGAITTENPVLIVFVDHQYEWPEFFMIIPGEIIAVYASSASDLLRQRGTTIDREIDVSLRFE